MRISENFKTILILIEAAVLVIVVVLSALSVFGVISMGGTGSDAGDTTAVIQNDTSNAIHDASYSGGAASWEDVHGEEAEIVYSFDVDAVLGAMSQDQKVAQLILTTPELLTRNSRVTAAGSTTQRAIQNTPVGAMLYTADNYVDDEQISTLMTNTADMVSQATWVGMYYIVASRDGYTTPYTEAADAAEVISAIAQTEAIGDEEVDPHFDEVTPDTGSIYDAIMQTAGGTAVYVDGARMIYCTGNVQNMFNSINGAVSDGTIAAEDLDAAVREILEAKATH